MQQEQALIEADEDGGAAARPAAPVRRSHLASGDAGAASPELAGIIFVVVLLVGALVGAAGPGGTLASS